MKKTSPFFEEVRRVLRDAFPAFLGGHPPAAPEKKSLPPEELRGREKPFTAENPPASIQEANQRQSFLKRRRLNWSHRGKSDLYGRIAAMSDEDYAARAESFRGEVQSVMRTDAKEFAFLRAWVDGQIRDRRRLADEEAAKRRPPRKPDPRREPRLADPRRGPVPQGRLIQRRSRNGHPHS